MVFVMLAVPGAVNAAVPNIQEIVSDFKTVFGKSPTAAEQEYWKSRRDDKGTRSALKGAMYYAKARDKTIGDPPVRTARDLANAAPTAFKRV